MTGFYDHYVLPWFLDAACQLPMVSRQRARLVPQARGRVLEIGFGTGLNLAHYDRSKVTALYGLDPAEELHRRARKRARRAGIEVELLALSAESIPMPDASFDTVVTTFTLCSIPDPLAALREMRRVLKPDGQLLFCEHGAAPDAAVLRWQTRLTPWWKQCAGGCHLDRDVPALLEQAGLVSQNLSQKYVGRPHWLAYLYRGTATR
jgi:Methylase involved in ubiquinone/menaquinone biosynthesis